MINPSSMKSAMLKAGLHPSPLSRLCDCCSRPQHRCEKLYARSNAEHRAKLIQHGWIVVKGGKESESVK